MNFIGFVRHYTKTQLTICPIRCMLEPKKIYVRPDNTIVLTCPDCGHQREVLVSLFRGKRKLRIKCCDTFKVTIEFRRRVRKRTQLKGTCINHSQKDKEDDIAILDLSVTGLSFTCPNFHLFNVEDELTIEFVLDDEHETVISKEAIIRGVRKSSAGCEFTSGGVLALEGPLGYYIMHVLP
jgi:hypothetical protein